MAVKFTQENFNSEVLEAKGLVVVDFYADWCGPCQRLAPSIEELAQEYEGSVKIGKLNVDEAQATAQKYRVMTIPTIIMFKDGEVKETLLGGDKDTIKEKIEAHK